MEDFHLDLLNDFDIQLILHRHNFSYRTSKINWQKSLITFITEGLIHKRHRLSRSSFLAIMKISFFNILAKRSLAFNRKVEHISTKFCKFYV